MMPISMLAPLLAVVSLACVGCGERRVADANLGAGIVATAYEVPDGGGYFLNGTGVTKELSVGTQVVLPATRQGSHCSGFTLSVCTAVATENGLMDGWDASKLRKFQRQWFGVDAASAHKQMAFALREAGIGREVKLIDVRPGDFIQFNGGSWGHVAVVTGVIMLDHKLVGINFRSSQPMTGGVGDSKFYFGDTIFGGSIRRDRCTVARLGHA